MTENDPHPDETGPFQCELCADVRPGPREEAEAAKWLFTWDGWVCPRHQRAQQ